MRPEIVLPNSIQEHYVLVQPNRLMIGPVSFARPFSFYLFSECIRSAMHDDKYIFRRLDIPRTNRILIFQQHPRNICKPIGEIHALIISRQCKNQRESQTERETYNISGGHSFFLSMFLFDHFQEFFFVPVLHCIVFVGISHIHIDASLLNLPLDSEIMRELTSITFATLTSFEEGANHWLGIGTFFDFLRLHRPNEQPLNQLIIMQIHTLKFALYEQTLFTWRETAIPFAPTISFPSRLSLSQRLCSVDEDRHSSLVFPLVE